VTSATEVTMLTPAEAEHFNSKSGSARLNVALYRLAISPHRLNAGFVRLGAPAPEVPSLPPLELRYLVTAYSAPGPAEKNSAERLLEASLRAIGSNPRLSTAQLQSALPEGSTLDSNMGAAIEFEDLTQTDLLNLFTNLRAAWRPALTLLARLFENGDH